MTWSPAIGILGMRQTGKSTLVRGLCTDFLTFDDPSALRALEEGGGAYLESLAPPVGLDEAQKAPPVFDLVKLVSDRSRKPGRFLLTGSVRFASRGQIRESLTGRIALFELRPLTLSEAHGHRLSPFLNQLTSDKSPAALLTSFEKKA